MLTEQILKNRSQIPGKARKLHLLLLKYYILCADDHFVTKLALIYPMRYMWISRSQAQHKNQ